MDARAAGFSEKALTMSMTEGLKLVGLDAEDLDIISAHVQDAVFKVGDLDYSPQHHQFVLTGNRFVWEEAGGRNQRTFERRRSVLHFDCVKAVRTLGISRSRPDDVLALLSVRFLPGKTPPAGEIELIFAGDASIAIEVECVEVQLADQGGAWETAFRPKHPLSD
jgi:hypothetical protein